MKYEYQIQERYGDDWFAIGHTFESLLACRRKVDELREIYVDDFRIMYRLVPDWDFLEEYGSEVKK